MKILIVKLSSIGDVVHTLPALAAIRRDLPGAEISWVVEKKAAGILLGNEYLRDLIIIDTKALRKKDAVGMHGLLRIRRQLGRLRSAEFDVAIDFQGLIKSAAIAKLAHAGRRFGFSKKNLREPAARFLLTDSVKVKEKTHVIRKNLQLAAKALGIRVPAPEDYEFPVTTEPRHRREAERIIERTGAEGLVILNPAGGWPTKLWPAENFGRLADRLWEELGLTPVITTGPGEEALAERVLGAARTGRAVAVRPGLKGFFELAGRAKIYVGGDTAPTHLAVAAGTPVVGIFGPTEWWRNGSPRAEDICVARGDIECRVDCHRRACDNWICMEIDVETVFRAVEKRLQSEKKARRTGSGLVI